MSRASGARSPNAVDGSRRSFRAVAWGSLGEVEASAVRARWPGRKARAGDRGVLAVGEGSKASVTRWARDERARLEAGGCVVDRFEVKEIVSEPDCD